MSEVALDLDALDRFEGVTFEPAEFWMVWTKTGWPPRKAHDSFGAAQVEAHRLAHQFPGKKFIILEAVSKIHLPLAVAGSEPQPRDEPVPGEGSREEPKLPA